MLITVREPAEQNIDAAILIVVVRELTEQNVRFVFSFKRLFARARA
jgi:hypothetical protein